MKSVLFYLQPRVIRHNPMAFEWVLGKYRPLAAGLSAADCTGKERVPYQ